MPEKRALLLLNQAPFDCDLSKHLMVLGAAAEGGALLMQDAVYFAATERGRRLLDAGVRVYALRESLEARGVIDRVLEGVHVVDYGEAVDLIMERYDIVV